MDHQLDQQPKSGIRRLAGKAFLWSLTAGCFYLVYARTTAAAAREDIRVVPAGNSQSNLG